MKTTTPSNLPNANPLTNPVAVPTLSSLPALNVQSAVIKPGAVKVATQKANEADLNVKASLVTPKPVTPVSVNSPAGSPVPAGYDPATGMPIGWKPAAPPATPPAGSQNSGAAGGQAGQGGTNAGGNAQTQPYTPPGSKPGTVDGAVDPYAKAALETPDFATTPQGQQYYQDFAKAAQGALTLSEQQKEEAKQYGLAAGMRYDSLIADAKLKSQKGKASNFVQAAKSGGLDSSAWAGVAALVGAPAGVERLEGIGGALESMASAYDQVVANLESEKQQAIIAATQAREEYLLTRNKDSYKIASDLFDKAKSMYDDQIKLNMAKSETLRSYQEYLTKTTKDAYDAAENDIKTLAGSGMAATDFDDKKKRDFELSLRLPHGSFDSYYKAQFDAAQAKTQEDKVKAATSVIDLLNKIPVGQKVTIGDATYEGTGEDKNIVTYKETDRNGNVMILEYNKDTKEVTTVKTGIKVRVPGSGGGGSSGQDEKRQKQALDDAVGLIQDLDGDKLSWGAAFDTMRVKYPELTPDAINGLLGGGIPYNEATKKFETKQAWGRAVKK